MTRWVTNTRRKSIRIRRKLPQKEAKTFASSYCGHKVRILRSCPDEKIYLLSYDDFLELKYGVERISKN